MIRLVCFDFDGVIAQTEGQHTKWLMEDLDKAGVTYTKERKSCYERRTDPEGL